MQFQGKFIFTSVQKVDAGQFKNSNGDIIQYPSSYKLLLDYWKDGNKTEVKLKIPEESVELFNKLKNLKPYQEIILECKVEFFNSNVKVIPIDFKVDSNNK